MFANKKTDATCISVRVLGMHQVVPQRAKDSQLAYRALQNARGVKGMPRLLL